jgi:hypothetical protein
LACSAAALQQQHAASAAGMKILLAMKFFPVLWSSFFPRAHQEGIFLHTYFLPLDARRFEPRGAKHN